MAGNKFAKETAKKERGGGKKNTQESELRDVLEPSDGWIFTSWCVIVALFCTVIICIGEPIAKLVKNIGRFIKSKRKKL